MCKVFSLAVVCAVVMVMAGTVQAGVTVTVQEVGSDVLFSGSGTLNLTGLSSVGTQSTAPGVEPDLPAWGVGLLASPDIDVYVVAPIGSLNGPSSFGSGSVRIDADSGTGDVFGIGQNFGVIALAVPQGFVSTNSVTGSATYTNTDLATLGIDIGTYTWMWPGDSITLNVIPEPASLMLLGLGGVLLLGRRRSQA